MSSLVHVGVGHGDIVCKGVNKQLVANQVRRVHNRRGIAVGPYDERRQSWPYQLGPAFL